MFSFDENRNSSCDILNIPGNIHEIFHKNYEKLKETFQSRNRCVRNNKEITTPFLEEEKEEEEEEHLVIFSRLQFL